MTKIGQSLFEKNGVSSKGEFFIEIEKKKQSEEFSRRLVERLAQNPRELGEDETHLKDLRKQASDHLKNDRYDDMKETQKTAKSILSRVSGDATKQTREDSGLRDALDRAKARKD